MKYLIPLILFFSPVPALAQCPDQGIYLSHIVDNYEAGGYYFTYVRMQKVGGGYQDYYAGYYNNGVYADTSLAAVFDIIPLSAYDTDTHNLFRGYVSGQLETDLIAGYAATTPINTAVDISSYSSHGYEYTGCDATPPQLEEPTMSGLAPWFEYACMWLGVIGIGTTFLTAFSLWDLVLRAKQNPKFWVLFLVVFFPSYANAQGNYCNKVPIFQDYTVVVGQTQNGNSSVSLRVNWTDGTTAYGVKYGDGYGIGLLGQFAFSGIPYDRYLSDPQLRGLWNSIGYLPFLDTLFTHGATVDLSLAPDLPLIHCGCNIDPSYPVCPEYDPSGPDIPTYCADGETEDTAPDDPDCGCPGQDYTVCDGTCPDADNDLCCDEVDPKPDDPDCGCTRAGPTGECAGDCPECEKLLTDYAEDFRVLFSEYGVDLSMFYGRGANSRSLNVFLPAPPGPTFSGITGWSYGSDESFLEDSPLKLTLQTTRVVFRSICLLLCLYIFTMSILRVALY